MSQDLRYYHFVAQAELQIDGVDDKEEMKITDVNKAHFLRLPYEFVLKKKSVVFKKFLTCRLF